MTTQEEILGLIHYQCSRDPSFLRKVIDAATEGVKTFADNQKDDKSKFLAMLTDVIENNDDLKTKYFPIKEIVEKLLPCYGGTPFEQKLKKRFRL